MIISAGNRPRRRRRAFWTGESLGAPRFYFFAASGPTCGLEPPFLGEPPRVGSATAPGAPRTTKGLTATAEDDGASRRRRLRGRRGERPSRRRSLDEPRAEHLERLPHDLAAHVLCEAPSRPRARAVRGGVSLVARARARRSPPVATLARARLHARFRPVVAGASLAPPASVHPRPDAPRTAPATVS